MAIISLILYVFFSRKEIYIEYKIKYSFRGKIYKISAFYDTGCNLVYKGLPVIILNDKYNFNIETSDKVLFHNGIGEFYQDCFYIKNLHIGKSEIECYCIFLKIDYEAIIGSNIIFL